jgi:homoserine kinase
MILYAGDESEIDQIPSLASGFTAMKLAIAKNGVE